jgi:hypothetical protein
MGERTAVASAKRGVRGDLSEGTLSDGAEESSEEARGREETVTVLGGFSEVKSDIA